MPYPGVNDKNTSWMENCVKKVMATGKSKGDAIAICKTTLDKRGEKDSSVQEYLKKLNLDKILDI